MKDSLDNDLEDIGSKMTKMSLRSGKSAVDFSFEDINPFIQYPFVGDDQKMIVVEVLVQGMPDEMFHFELSKCGRKLLKYTAIPEIL